MILITAKAHPYLMETLTKKGLPFLYAPTIGYAELLAYAPQLTGVIVTTRIPIDKAFIDKATQLQWIGRLGSGMELIDVTYASQKNIRCVSSPEGNRNAVAEHALGMLLAIRKHLLISAEEVKQRLWLREENRGTELKGKTIGIIGFGNTGTAFAQLLAGFEVKILAYDKYKQGFGKGQVFESDLDHISQEADIISFHVPLTEITHHMANLSFFRQLQKKPLIINTSRGAVIDTPALIMALQQQFISGAALDVLENEKVDRFSEAEQADFQFLIQQKNVLLTPHIAGYSHEALYEMSRVLLGKLDI